MMIALSKRSKIQAVILEEIKSGRLTPGQKLENERKLSNRLGVSRVTLSRGLSDLVEQGILIKKVGSGTYVADHIGELFSGTQKLALGLIVSYKNNPLVMNVLNGLHKVLPTEQCDIIIKDPQGKPDRERKLVQEMIDSKVDGIIMSTCHSFDSVDGRQFYEDISKVFPLIMTDCYVQGRIPHVVTNNYEGGKIAGEYLLSQSESKGEFWILKYGFPVSSLVDRSNGFSDAVKAHKTHPIHEVVFDDPTQLEKPLIGILKNRPMPAGIFISQDYLLSVLIKSAQHLNIDLSSLNICSYDNFHGIADLFGIPYIQQPFDELGIEIAKYIRALRNNQEKPIKNIQLLPHLEGA